MRSSTTLTLPVVLLFALGACSDRLRPARNAGELAFHLGLSSKLEFQVPDGILRERLLHVGSDLDGFDVRILRPGEQGARTAARVVLGTLETPGVKELVATCGVTPIETGETGFHWLERDYDRATDALVLTFEDPQRRGLPVTVYLGNDLERLASYIEDLRPAARPSAKSFVRGQLERSAPLSLSGDVYTSDLVDHDLRRRKLLGKLFFNHQTKSGVRVSAPVESERITEYVAAVEAAAGRAGRWMGGEAEGPVRLIVSERPGDMELLDGELRTHSLNRVMRSVRVLVADGLPDDGGAGAARAKALQLAGDPAERWLEHGLAVDAARSWWGVPLERWVKYLAKGEILTPEELTDPGIARRRSPHRVRPLQAMLFRYLRETRGVDALRASWRGGLPTLPGADEFNAWLELQLADVTLPERTPRTKRSLFRGICLSESANVGFATPAAARSLSEAHATGADAVTITSFMVRDPHLTDVAKVGRRSTLEAMEGDLALAVILKAARDQGLATVLRPQVLVSPSGSWTGGLVMTTEDDWRGYYADLARFLDHYGLLGELCSVDMIVAGSELLETSRSRTDFSAWDHPDLEQWKRDGWRRALTDVRNAFEGELTYASIWREETEEIEFWDQLDCVGCTLYSTFRHPQDPWLPPTENRVKHSTTKRVSDMLAFARSVGKPLVVLDLGVPSTELGWRAPRIADGETDPDMQALVIGAMGDALVEIAAENEDFRGVFLWNWWSDPDAGGTLDRGWSLQNKPAEAKVKGFFEKL